eukprot:CAMPEP_0181293084 /NCGR_PEP_ID=MMETSP1101-20121128/2871_1 /TAXON_ID=46948 /ORGANISM="Rhodomonas abbreviata, Strain Caron Lab Isolate" /LENGTH=451 /DNA_ID=CAMNT_0023397637 /DNA_START=16 /DNA_END=1371 /DNA_ORIENTATION=-
MHVVPAAQNDAPANRPAGPPKDQSLSTPDFLGCSVVSGRLSLINSGTYSKKQRIGTHEALSLRVEESCSDFGPVNIYALMKFKRLLCEMLEDGRHDKTHFVYCCRKEDKYTNNAIFLIATYLVLEMGWSARNACRPFIAMRGDKEMCFRSSSGHPEDFSLQILDCVSGVQKAHHLGFLLPTPDLDPVFGFCTLLNKFVVRDSVGAGLRLVETKVLLKDSVETLVRIGVMNQEDQVEVERSGVEYFSLSCTEVSHANLELVGEFLTICKQTKQIVVDSDANSGIIGLLIAAWLIRCHGFSAGESMGLLLCVMPGCLGPASALGELETFLKLVEAMDDSCVKDLESVDVRTSQEAEMYSPFSMSFDPTVTAGCQVPRLHMDEDLHGGSWNSGKDISVFEKHRDAGHEIPKVTSEANILFSLLALQQDNLEHVGMYKRRLSPDISSHVDSTFQK